MELKYTEKGKWRKREYESGETWRGPTFE